MRPSLSFARARCGAAALWVVLGTASPTAAQWVKENEQFYYPAEHNWVFRQNYMAADRLFNAFDYGHAILYETLYAFPDAAVSELEEKRFDFLTQRLLRHPPRVPLEESAVEIAYAKLAPEAKLMFEWAHLLHRQIYDVLADERLSWETKDAEVATLLAYYKTRPDLAFSTVPKSMDLMDAQSYSLAFREKYPKFNGLIWAYHWLQVGLYEPMLVNHEVASRTAGVTATVARFWQMLEEAPRTMPYLMPMTAAIAPTFAARYPEAAIVFDNLHMMHDVISDILASPDVLRARKREEILKAAAAFRDDTSFVISREEWAMMGEMMGVHNMGGPAVGFTAALPEPTVPRGMSMAGMDHSQMAGMEGMQHGASGGPAVMDQPAMAHGAPVDSTGGGMLSDDLVRSMHDVHLRMMADPVIRERVATDPVLVRLLQSVPPEMMGDTTGVHDMGGGAADAVTTPPDAALAMDFVMLLLSDPEIEARVHADPRLHLLWSDPEVQRCLETIRGLKAAGHPLPAACPATPAGP